MRNPCGSVKDRLGVALIDDAERRGVLRPGATLIEATGGNTGIGLAFAAAIRGYRLILTMPESMSKERVALLQHLGAEVVLTPGILMTEAVARAAQLAAKIPGALVLDQFRNPANPALHRQTTAMEIWDDTQGAVDAFVSAVGTGGTITGVGEVLKARKRGIRVVAVEPAGAAVLSGRSPGSHQMPGIGVGFLSASITMSGQTCHDPAGCRVGLKAHSIRVAKSAFVFFRGIYPYPLTTRWGQRVGANAGGTKCPREYRNEVSMNFA
jgi:cysteine synthase A